MKSYENATRPRRGGLAIDRRMKVPLTGLPQTIHIWSTDLSNPLLLFLHGGPGIPDRHAIHMHDLDLTDSFTIVAWDQRGTGGSYSGCAFKSLCTEQLVEDAAELVEMLCERLHIPRVFIVGRSWGSQLGTMLVARHPEHIAGYVGMGQVVDGHENERLSYEFCMRRAQAAGDKRSLHALRAVGPPRDGQYRHGIRGLLTERRVLARYGGHGLRTERYLTDMLWPMLGSHEYTVADLWGISRGAVRSLETLWPTAVHYNFRTLGRVNVPYYIFQGRYDFNTPSSLVAEYYQGLEAPDKDLIWFEHSAHNPLAQEPERCKRQLREKLLAIPIAAQ